MSFSLGKILVLSDLTFTFVRGEKWEVVSLRNEMWDNIDVCSRMQPLDKPYNKDLSLSMLTESLQIRLISRIARSPEDTQQQRRG